MGPDSETEAEPAPMRLWARAPAGREGSGGVWW